jgi:DnaJ family protein C protein 2
MEREALLMGDLYGLLNLEHLTFEAGHKEIKKAYNKLALVHHPDKVVEKFGDAEKDLWLKIQNAYETLSDETRRRKYDSSLPFDERIPKKEDVTEATFFELFSACFKLNARFARKRPAPSIGDLETPYADVKKFYSYWSPFDTWREFSSFDEYDPKDAGDRYEKRWMEKENKHIRDKYVKAERKRLIKLH